MVRTLWGIPEWKSRRRGWSPSYFSEPLLLWPQNKPATSRPQRTFLASSCLDLAKPVGFRLSREAIMKQWHAEFVLVSEGCWSALQKFPSNCLISRSQAKHRHPQKQYLEITFRWTDMITGNPPGCHGKTLSHHHPIPSNEVLPQVSVGLWPQKKYRYGGFLKCGDPQVIMAFIAKSWSNDLDMIWGYPHLMNFQYIYHIYHKWVPL